MSWRPEQIDRLQAEEDAGNATDDTEHEIDEGDTRHSPAEEVALS